MTEQAQRGARTSNTWPQTPPASESGQNMPPTSGRRCLNPPPLAEWGVVRGRRPKPLRPDGADGRAGRKLPPGGHHPDDGPLVVHWGIDTLKLAYKCELRAETLGRLYRAREKAQAMGGPASVHLHGQLWAVHPVGAGGLEYRISNADCTVCIGDDAFGWTVTVEFRSTWLTRNGLKAFAVGSSIACTFGPVREERVRRVDMAADVQGLEFDVEDWRAFVTRARNVDPHVTYGELSGFTWGRGDIMARLYRKDKELRERNNEEKLNLMHHVWSEAGADPAGVVWRLELQLRFKALESMRAQTTQKLRARLDAIWHYAFCANDNGEQGAWLRLVDGSASRRERSRLDARWRIFREVTWGSQYRWQLRRRGKRGGATYEQLRGCLLSWAASAGNLKACEGPEDAPLRIAELLRLFERELLSEGLMAERLEGARARFAELDDWSVFESAGAA